MKHSDDWLQWVTTKTPSPFEVVYGLVNDSPHQTANRCSGEVFHHLPFPHLDV